MSAQSSQIKVEDKLRSMKNRTFMYNTMLVQILSWKYEAEYCTIVTSAPWITQKIVEMLKFINENFHEVEADEATSGDLPDKQSSNSQSYEAIPKLNFKSLSKADDLVELLFDNINKVTESKDHVDQANAVANLAGKIMHVAKTQIDAARLEVDLHRNR